MRRVSALHQLSRIVAILLLSGGTLAPISVYATTFVVDSESDAVDTNPGDGQCATTTGACTLRAAIQEHNAISGSNVITLPSGLYLLTIPGPGEDDAATGDLDTRWMLTIEGDGRDSTVVDANGLEAAFDLVPYGVLTLRNLTVRHGSAPMRREGDLTFEGVAYANNDAGIESGLTAFFRMSDSIFVNNGGGIAVAGKLSIERSIISGNGYGVLMYYSNDPDASQILDTEISYNGGPGIRMGQAGLVIRRSTIRGNTGGGVNFESHDTSLSIEDSTIVGNSTPGNGGGVLSSGGCSPTTILNSTISANRADGHGGGIYYLGGGCAARLRVTRTTVAANSADADADGNGDGGGVYAVAPPSFGQAEIGESIIALNVDRGGEAPDCFADVLSSVGYNLISDPRACTLVGNLNGNQLGVGAGLNSLMDNGGPTATHSLSPSSPARDAGEASCTGADQRGVPRPQFGRCDIGAYEFACGNSTIDPGEDCDDGNAVDGDCCSSGCRFDAMASPCSDDDNVCTDDSCNGVGSCQHVANTAPCNDGSACSVDDTCAGGTCQPGPALDCPICEACNPASGCAAAPLPSCKRPVASGKASLLLRDRTPNSGDLLQWKWLRGAQTLPADFGNPLATDDYTLCIFDESGPTPEVLLRAVAPAGDDCAGRPCWSLKNDRYTYRDRDHTPDGLEQITPRSGADGKAKILVKGKRDNLDMPTLPLPLPARVQLQAGDGVCWEGTYSAAGVSKNDGGQFKGKAD